MIGARAEHTIESRRKLRIFDNLPGVGFAHGRHEVGKDNSDLHEIEHPIELEWACGVELRLVESRVCHRTARKGTLVREVMNRENRASTGKERIVSINLAHVSRDERGLVVMTMQNIHFQRRGPNKFECGALKENPTRGLIGVVLSGLRIHIDPLAIEEAVVSDQENTYSRTGQGCAVHVECEV